METKFFVRFNVVVYKFWNDAKDLLMILTTIIPDTVCKVPARAQKTFKFEIAHKVDGFRKILQELLLE